MAVFGGFWAGPEKALFGVFWGVSGGICLGVVLSALECNLTAVYRIVSYVFLFIG